MNNISWVVQDGLCTGCGVCEGICPQNAIKISIDKYGICTPTVDIRKCALCGLCEKVCPGLGFDYKALSQTIHGRMPGNMATGRVINAYAGYVNDSKILNVAQSGGFVSASLIYGLENNLFDGVVVTKWSETSPFTPVVYIARNREEVLQAVGSKYHPVPVASIVREIKNMKSGRFAFVGTPCQIQGMRKAEQVFPKLAKRISLYIGLHCLGVFNYHYQDQILSKINKKRSEIKSFQFRSKKFRGWPCDMLLETNSGEEINLLASYSKLNARSFFTNWRCQLCFDKLNEFSDVSCGDCRIASAYCRSDIRDVYYKSMGKSDIITKTPRGDKFVNLLSDSKILTLKKMELKDIAKSTKVAEKKLGISYAGDFARLIGRKAPDYGVKFEIDDVVSNKVLVVLQKNYTIFSYAHYWLCYRLIKHSWFRLILKLLPHGALKLVAEIRERLTIPRIYGSSDKLKIVEIC
ncbi:Coenzyme F420 hydrogenase/dehydrogenase, beta subunit C-terminal domain [Candidatus Dojkabacteria bacterium]|nr:Coenzyme F420 hydrogenase/dehydrogenase, beta subunit C-terminal domain [Candidatus Dojkabacteria bacterium]